MTGLDFFADLAVTGTVLGLDHTSTLAEVAAVFDIARTEISPRSLLSGSGLIEFGWNRRNEGDGWTVQWFGAQAHRLADLVEDGEVEPPLAARYGEFPARVHVDDLLAATARLGHPLRQVPDANEDCVAYWSPVSDMHVLAANLEGTDEQYPPGTVLKMLGPQPWWPWHRFAGRELEFAKHARRLMAMTPAERSAWLDAEDPVDEPPEVRRDWWGCLTNMLGRKADGHGLVVELHRRSAERGVCTVAEAAVAEIGQLARAYDKGVSTESTDDAVSRWLVHVPQGGDVRSDRVLRNQIHGVREGLPHLTDPGLADAVRPWLELRPALLAGGATSRLAAD